MPLLISGPQSYFGGFGLFIELDDDIDDFEEFLASQTTLNESLAESAEELMQLDSSTNAPCQDNSSNTRWAMILFACIGVRVLSSLAGAAERRQYSQTMNNHWVPSDNGLLSLVHSLILHIAVHYLLQYIKFPYMAVSNHNKVYL